MIDASQHQDQPGSVAVPASLASHTAMCLHSQIEVDGDGEVHSSDKRSNENNTQGSGRTGRNSRGSNSGAEGYNHRGCREDPTEGT